MRRNDRETEIRMMTMEEYLKKRQAIRRRGNMGAVAMAFQSNSSNLRNESINSFWFSSSIRANP